MILKGRKTLKSIVNDTKKHERVQTDESPVNVIHLKPLTRSSIELGQMGLIANKSVT